MIPTEVTIEVERRLSQVWGRAVKVQGSRPVSGGCIHHGCRLETNLGLFFLKYNYARALPNFEAEARGLGILREKSPLFVPRALFTGNTPGHAFALIEFIETAPRKADFFGDFGRQLALQHQVTEVKYGLDHDNFIGSLEQRNAPTESWVDFFIGQRLQPQLALARDRGLISREINQQFERLFSRLQDLMPAEPPSLLHGDLWSGNFMTGPDGTAAIFDPAVYYGHREAEIAFTQLFGGFPPDFYQAYHETWPLQSGWQQRVDLFNLYPILVHVNLFGVGYVSQVTEILRHFA
ncbi:MAG: fructosamine kinase family protein [Bacteroidia bacterium]|nr:fructosamine kinase family protein [Bacteroidia bacterium]